MAPTNRPPGVFCPLQAAPSFLYDEGLTHTHSHPVLPGGLKQPVAGDRFMAAGTSFKQQCPSCEAMVPIRDPGLIGRKIDCPKCKYRFVVEEPAGDEEEDAAPVKKKG